MNANFLSNVRAILVHRHTMQHFSVQARMRTHKSILHRCTAKMIMKYPPQSHAVRKLCSRLTDTPKNKSCIACALEVLKSD